MIEAEDRPLRHSTTLTAGLSALCLVLGTARVAHADDWTSVGLNATHARATTERSGDRFTGQRWSQPFAGNAYGISSPATADGIVVVGGHDGFIHAVAASDGHALWEFRTGDSVEASPAILNGLAFVPSQDGKLYALHLADGQLAWQHDLGGLEQSSPIVVHDRLGDGVVVAHGFPGRTLVRLDAVSGDVIWETTPDVMAQFSNSSAASDGTYLVIGANEGHYYGFDLATGTRLWTFEADGIVNLAAPVIAQGRVFLFPGGESNKLHALDIATGKAIEGWPVEVPEPAPSSTSQHLFRHYSVSSLSALPGKLIFDLRFDDSADTDGDTLADRFLMTETVVALSTIDGHRLWQVANGRGDVASFNDMPKSGLCPTPALYQAMSAYGNVLAVVTSTLDGTLRVLDTGTGATVWSTLLPSVSRASPLLANGRLILATDDGVLLSRGSATNTAPSAPTFTGGTVRTVSDAAPAVDWAASLDREGDAVTYQLRLDHDGEVLETWEATATLSGDTRWRIPGTLKAGTSYIVAARARDTNGAWSDWSAPQFLDVVAAPPIAVNGHGVTSLGDALRAAQAGDIVTLGVGTMVLTETLRVAGGVTLEGAGAQRTILDARGQSIAVSFDGSAPGQPSEVRGLTVTGARVGISVGNAKDARISHVILRDNSDAGLDVGASGTATLTNATLVSNGVAARSFGVLVAKNNLVLRNTTGFAADHVGALTTRFNDVSGNTVDYLGLVAAASDLSTSVVFTDFAKHDLHLGARQPTTDQGDPADDFSAEPQPNGGRINLGAFGGTSDAELSLAPSTSVGEPGGPPTPVDQPRHVGTTAPSPTPEAGEAYSAGGGCSVAPSSGSSWSALAAAACLGLVVSLRHRRRTRRWQG